MARRSFKGGKLSQSLKSARASESKAKSSKKKKSSSSNSSKNSSSPVINRVYDPVTKKIVTVSSYPSTTKTTTPISPPKTTNTSTKSSSSGGSSKKSSSKKIVIYDSTGKVTQSTDSSKPVGMIDTTKAKTSSANLDKYSQPASVSFKRTGSTITRTVHSGGKVVSSEVVQDSSTSSDNKKTTSQLVGQEAIMRSTANRTLPTPSLQIDTSKQDANIQKKIDNNLPLTSAEQYRVTTGSYATSIEQLNQDIAGLNPQETQKQIKSVSNYQKQFDPKPIIKDAKFYDVKTHTFFPDEPEKTIFFKSQRPVDNILTPVDNILTEAKLNQIIKGEYKPSFRENLKNFGTNLILAPIRGAGKTIEYEKEFFTQTYPNLFKQNVKAITSKDIKTKTDFFYNVEEERKKNLKLIKDADVQNFALTVAGGSLIAKSAPLLMSKTAMKKIGTTILMGTTARESVRGIGRITFDEDLKQIKSEKQFKDALKLAEAKLKEEVYEKYPVKGRVYNVVPALFEGKTKGAFEAQLRKELILQGYKGARFENALAMGIKQRAFVASGELAGALATEATTERIGAHMKWDFSTKLKMPKVAKVGVKGVPSLTAPIFVKSTGKKLESQAYKQLFPLGVGEGLSEYINEKASSGGQVTTGGLLFSGAFGGVIAGKVGAKIISSKTGTESFLRRSVANVADPLEKGGDWISDVSGSIASKLSRTSMKSMEDTSRKLMNTIKAPIKTFTLTGIVPTQTELNKKFKVGSFSEVTTPTSKTNLFTPTNEFANVFQTSVNFNNLPSLSSSVNLPASSFPSLKKNELSFKNSLKTNTFFPTEVNLNNNINNFVNSNINSNVEVDLFSNVNTNVNENVNQFVNTNVNVNQFVNEFVTVPSNVNTSVSTNVPVYLAPIPPIPKFGKTKKGQGYNVQIKTKGKWNNMNKKPLYRESALSFGREIVDNSSEASFKISKSKSKAKPLNYLGSGNDFKFKKKKNLFIEKNTFRIDSMGELKKITAKGIAKRSKKNFF